MKINRQPLKRIDLVCVPRRGKPRTYAINPLTVGAHTWGFLVAMMALFEEEVRAGQDTVRFLRKKIRR